MSNRAASKAQNAMEYLTTYGWAILVVALVVAALFQLGVIGGSTGPRAQPGNCQVYRPDGPYSTDQLGLVGACDGELPLSVSKFTPPTYLEISQNFSISGNTMTVSAWVEPNSYTTLSGPREDIMSCKGQQGHCFVFSVNSQGSNELDFEVNILGSGWEEVDSPAGALSTLNRWYFVTGVYNGVAESVWVNGQQVATATLNGMITTGAGTTFIGSSSEAQLHYWPGYMSNLQVYSAALNSNQIYSLYLKGIGGAPSDLVDLYAWWPLNGNGNDYSGDAFSANYISAGYISQWSSGYSAP